ncbi:MAG: hypothetical protein JGK21_01055 [Microcoleus sp. PH2017_22_RUC_O_B]|nr:hypothetical protein [Microcoleus sp. PH2017_22_RUC_O_B]MCC3538985.1 hypothetical protein [Microcoleus sp. PH2017_22_RUC_O_B]
MSKNRTLYPTITKYYSAISHPQIAFKNLDPILATGQAVKIYNPHPQGMQNLWTAAGGCACVFKYETFNPKRLWAVRCFLQSTSSVASHYSKVSSRLQNIGCSSYFVECSFLNQGIRVDGISYPIVKMEWVEGKDLKSFIQDNLNNKNKLDLLVQAWVRLSKDLLTQGLAHGDLQHGNILVDDRNGVTLKLIDYDSLYFAVDGNSIDDESKGFDGYQHPLRDNIQKQCLEIDFFSQLVIYISIIAVAENPKLWQNYKLDKTERLLFSKNDFRNPDQAQVFQTLSQLSPNVSQLADELKRICKLTDFNKIPSLDAVLTPPTQIWTPTSPIPGATPSPHSTTTSGSTVWTTKSSVPSVTSPPNSTPTSGSTVWTTKSSIPSATQSPHPTQTSGSTVWTPKNPIPSATTSPNPTPISGIAYIKFKLTLTLAKLIPTKTKWIIVGVIFLLGGFGYWNSKSQLDTSSIKEKTTNFPAFVTHANKAKKIEAKPNSSPKEEVRSQTNSPTPSVSTEQVNFDKGSTQKTISSSLLTNETKRYSINCGSGQPMTVQIKQGDINVAIISPNGQAIGNAVKAGTQWKGQLPSDGDYIIEVSAPSQSDYTINIEVLPSKNTSVSSTPTTNTPVSSTPEQTIKNYYELTVKDNKAAGKKFTSDNFRNKYRSTSSDDQKTFVSNFNSIEVTRAEPINKSATEAKITAWLLYSFKDGREQACEYRDFTLILNNNNYLIDHIGEATQASCP